MNVRQDVFAQFFRCFRFVESLSNLAHACDCSPCTDVRCNLAHQAQKILEGADPASKVVDSMLVRLERCEVALRAISDDPQYASRCEGIAKAALEWEEA